MAAFELCFSIRKEFLKKKVSGENAFDLISVFRVQIQQAKSRSTTTTAFVFLRKFAEFYLKIFETFENISKYLKQACGLSVTGDIKIYQCHMIKR